MIGPQTKPGPVQYHRAPQGVLGRFKLANNLSQADAGVLFVEDVGKINLRRFQEMNQRPGSTAALIENVVDFAPGCLDIYFQRIGGRCRSGWVTCQICVDSPLSDAR